MSLTPKPAKYSVVEKEMRSTQANKKPVKKDTFLTGSQVVRKGGNHE
jgi:chlorite dismutase